ncbi:hypothetical protein EH223_10285 [candidate division KSB1 bacterium]|nr:hypothetical protein [candidate division KSB1 bacterium]RQW03302.1 MAG: hypothetical protein EH223_10285 [candidate division KSB1 bacterium]
MFNKKSLKTHPIIILFLLVPYFIFVTCSKKKLTGPEDTFKVRLEIALPKAASSPASNMSVKAIDNAVITVSAEGEPLFQEFSQNLVISDNTATGTLDVLKGQDRKFTVVLLSGGVTIFCGSRTIDILDDTFNLDFQFSKKCTDITVENLSDFTFAGAGEKITVTWTTSNTGAEPISEAFDDEVWLSTTPGAFNKDVLLGSFRHENGLDVDARLPVSMDVVLPVPLPGPAGTYSIFVENDGQGEVEESDETNNRILKDITLLGSGDLRVTLTWNTDSTDVDIHIFEPDGNHVFFADSIGTTAELDVDNTVGRGPENVFVGPGQALPGTFQIFIINHAAADDPPPVTEATIEITLFANTAQETKATFTRTLTDIDVTLGINVADVTFPGGIITETFGSRTISDMRVTLTWDTDYTDLDIRVTTPDGTTESATIFDNDGYGTESYVLGPGWADDGTYQIFVVSVSGGEFYEQGLNATIEVTIYEGTTMEATSTFDRTLFYMNEALGINVADVDFPAGTISETFGTRDNPGDLLVTLTWDTDSTNLDLVVRDPEMNGIGSTYDAFGFGPEEIFVSNALDGTYEIFVALDYIWLTTEATIKIDAFPGTPNKVSQTITRTISPEDSLFFPAMVSIGTVTFPDGIISETPNASALFKQGITPATIKKNSTPKFTNRNEGILTSRKKFGKRW